MQVSEGGSLGAALEHCMYAGSALSRVGLDFRALLPPLFEGRILQLFTQVSCSFKSVYQDLLYEYHVDLHLNACELSSSSSSNVSLYQGPAAWQFLFKKPSLTCQ